MEGQKKHQITLHTGHTVTVTEYPSGEFTFPESSEEEIVCASLEEAREHAEQYVAAFQVCAFLGADDINIGAVYIYKTLGKKLFAPDLTWQEIVALTSPLSEERSN